MEKLAQTSTHVANCPSVRGRPYLRPYEHRSERIPVYSSSRSTVFSPQKKNKTASRTSAYVWYLFTSARPVTGHAACRCCCCRPLPRTCPQSARYPFTISAIAASRSPKRLSACCKWPMTDCRASTSSVYHSSSHNVHSDCWCSSRICKFKILRLW